ncbi:unnamed protein product, partial [Ectocarpus sp. 12 AP-2014]
AKAAEEIASGRDRGELHGIPVGIKDLLQTGSALTRVGSIVYSDGLPLENASVVDRLEEAGAICLGKLTMTEFALSGYHPELESPVNPWNPNHWSGVSSSGSGVAIAAGLATATIGSDTGGSIRLPAATNGVVGIKPTYGRVSRHNAFPLAESLDHIGPLANSIEDAAIVLGSIAGYDPLDPTSISSTGMNFREFMGQPITGLRIGIDRDYNSQVDPEVGNALEVVAHQLEKLGATVVNVSVAGIEEGANEWYNLTAAEAAVHHDDTYPSRSSDYGPVFTELLEHGHSLSPTAVSRAYTARGRVSQILRRAFDQMDALLCPSLAGPPPSLEEFPPQLVLPPEAVGPIVLYQAPFNFSGNPTISAPMGFSASGLPLSLQLVGRHNEEARLIQLAHAFEQATVWHQQIAP